MGRQGAATRLPGEKTSRRRASESRDSSTLISPRRLPSVSLVAPSPLITLLTDFGTADYFSGAMKGVILTLSPAAQIIDISHEISPQDVSAAAFVLLASYRSFPPGTIHVAVVDPGVGSSRRAILVAAGGHLFVGPDNGIFSYICDRHADYRVIKLTNEKYFCRPISATFHGRDIFAPVAAALSRGVELEEFGPEIKDEIRLRSLAPRRLTDSKLEARIIHIDRFGNCITNLTPDDLPFDRPGGRPQLRVNGKTVKSFRRFFSEEGSKEKLFGIWGSAGFLELAAANSSAAKILHAKPGEKVIVKIAGD